MKNSETKCDQQARIILPWGGKLLNYCPVHANKLVILANAMSLPIRAQRLSPLESVQCESNEVLTDEEKEFAKTFPV